MPRSYLKDYEVAYIAGRIDDALRLMRIGCDNTIFPAQDSRQSSFVSVHFLPIADCEGKICNKLNVPIDPTARPLVDHIAERCIMDIANYLKKEYVYKNKEDI